MLVVHLDRRSLLLSGAVGATLLGSRDPALAAPGTPTVLAENLQVPWGLAFLPGGDALVSERDTARIFRIRATGGKKLVGTVPGIAAVPVEGGLLGLAVSPTFAEDRWVYAYLTTPSDNRVIRMRYVDGALGKPKVVLAGIPSANTHNGGRLRFGPSGLLFVATGDTGVPDLAQQKKSLAGKVLRITPDGEVPPSNPFGTPVWSYGHRNVQGLSFDRQGRLWAAELGQNTRDELNRIRAGRNYGWPIVEGGDGKGPYADPIATWSPAEASPSGVAVARNRAWVAGLRGRALWSVHLTGPRKGRKVRHLHQEFGRLRAVEKAPDGSLWITTSNAEILGTPGPTDDRVLRLTL